MTNHPNSGATPYAIIFFHPSSSPYPSSIQAISMNNDGSFVPTPTSSMTIIKYQACIRTQHIYVLVSVAAFNTERVRPVKNLHGAISMDAGVPELLPQFCAEHCGFLHGPP